MVRLRDFIESKDGLFFSVTSYHHPHSKYIAFLKYYPDKKGLRTKGNVKYSKIGSTAESFEFLKANFRDYVFSSDITGTKLQCVPEEKVLKFYHPDEGLRDLYGNKPRGALKGKVLKISEALDIIPVERKGITGSILLGLYDEKTSDIDFVVYGSKNYERAREALKNLFGEKGIRPLKESEWAVAYKKRFPKKDTLSFKEFIAHEKRKYHKGIIDGTMFDILLVRDFDEINEYNLKTKFRRLGKVKIRCEVMDSSLAFDSPAVYMVKCDDKRIQEVVSYTHTYAGQAFEGEEMEVVGFLEEVLGKENYFRVVVGTTREAEGEYIKATGVR